MGDFDTFLDDTFKRFDTDKNLELSYEEVWELAKYMGADDYVFFPWRDHNGVVERVPLMDLDANGVVERAEFDKYLKDTMSYFTLLQKQSKLAQQDSMKTKTDVKDE